jgi:hypothetical protein
LTTINRLGWLFLIWSASVITMGAVALLIRFILTLAGLRA